MAEDTAHTSAWEPLGGWDQALGLRIVSASRDEVVAEYVVEARHHQGYGIAHGGVHCSAVETVCSTGAAMDAMPRGQSVVGPETLVGTGVRLVKVTLYETENGLAEATL